MTPASDDTLTRIAEHWCAQFSGDVHFLPVIGPVWVQPGRSLLPVLLDLLQTPETDFLAYDKNGRWAKAPWQSIDKSAITTSPSGVIIPVQHPKKSLTLHVASLNAELSLVDQAEQRAALALHSGLATSVQIIAPFNLHRPARIRLVFMCKYPIASPMYQDHHARVFRYSALPEATKRSLAQLAQHDSMTGFGFLCERLSEGAPLGDVFCTVRDGQISGAIGPLETKQDAWGHFTLLPSYFGVRPDCRRRGDGTSLAPR